ncbi:MAG TPA: PAS domain S-box protein [Burkholderiaceae bacterium]|nr:PAS domain S-box protein [Burkholderiaceae bacterium]
MNAPRPLAVHLAGLLASAIALGFASWFLGGRDGGVLPAILTILVPAGLAVGWLLVRQDQARQATQQTLQSVQARVSGIAESAMDPIISVDGNQRVVLFNAAAERAFRWPRAAVLGQPLDMLLPPRFHAVHRAHLAQFSDTGVTSRRMGGLNALTGVRASGEEFPIEASISQHVEEGRKVLTVILRDITERVRSEAMLARSQARLRGILDSAMDAIITVDDQQKIVFFNAAAEKMFGCLQDEAIGGALAWFIPDRFRSEHAAHVAQFGATGISSRRMGGSRVVVGLRRSGEEFPIDASISQLNDGEAKYYTVILRDVSERVRAHEALAQSREELREMASAASSAREQEQTRIARELHDEVAQAMSALKMDIKIIRGASSPADAAFAKRLDRMESQIDTTIAAMRRIAADLRPLALDDLGLIPAIEALVHDFERRTGVRCELALGDPDVALPAPHATAVFRIVQESLTNVVKHAKASTVEVVLAADDHAITVTVRDDGVGFSTSDPRKPQSYGLLGVRERAYLLGGETRILSAPGSGTEIEVRMPISADKPA